MFPSMRYVASIASAGLLFLFIWLMLPSSSNPEDVVRSYLGHLRHMQIQDNYNLLSRDVHGELSLHNIHNEYDYFDRRLGDFPPLRKYNFVRSEELDDQYFIDAEVWSAVDPYAQMVNRETGGVGPAVDTLHFVLVKQDGDWRINGLHVGPMAWLP